MKPERRLHLVPPPSSRERGGGDEPPFSDEEQREADALRAALEQGDDPLASALRAAHAPGDLDEGDLDAILARALGEGDAKPTRLEQRAADTLRDGLARGGELPREHAIAGDLRAAWRSGEISAERNEALIQAAIERAAPERTGRVLAFRRALPVTVGAITSLVAIAAGIALMFQRAEQAEPSASIGARPGSAAIARASLIRSRSTDDLFDPAEKFPVSGEESARIDRIALARASDLRQNRYAAWGVR